MNKLVCLHLYFSVEHLDGHILFFLFSWTDWGGQGLDSLSFCLIWFAQCEQLQWRIQDFPRGGGRQLPKLLLFFTFLPKTAWKWKNLDPQWGGARPWRPPWIRQWVTVSSYIKYISKLQRPCYSVTFLISTKCWTRLHSSRMCVARFSGYH